MRQREFLKALEDSKQVWLWIKYSKDHSAYIPVDKKDLKNYINLTNSSYRARLNNENDLRIG